VRRGDWKLSMDSRGGIRLYDLAHDPSELDDRSTDPACAGKCQELIQDLTRWLLLTQDPLPLPRRRYAYKRAEHNYQKGE